MDQTYLIVLDFDRTLFDTARFYRDFLAAISHTWGADLAASMQEVERTGEHLDPFHYLQNTHGIACDAVAQAFTAYIATIYPGGANYLFEGAPELIQYLRARPHTHVLIMTTGTKQSQTFKLGLCPELAPLEHRIISENKGKILQAEFEQAGGIAIGGRRFSHFVFVDDKASALTPIASHHRRILIHLLRPDAKFQDRTQRPDVHEVASLRDVIGLLR
jgi:FMN phosphatase YigB (HAD superfamily)